MQQHETRLRWTDASWRADADAWVHERVAELGRAVRAIEQPHVRPWGTVLRIETDELPLWFKASIAPLAYEVPLLAELGTRRPDAVTRLLAGDEAQGFMLMEAAGTRLTDIHPDTPPIELWQTFLPAYAQLQIDAAPAAEALVAAGVPDRRSPHLVEGLMRVLESPRLVRPMPDLALDDAELARLRALEPSIREAIEQIAALGLPDSVQHDDLHAWNVCVDEGGGFRFIDWGDACIAQPLLSLGVPIAHVPGEHAAAARDAYVEPWTTLCDRRELAAATDAAVLLAQITGILKWELISSVLSDAERAGYEDVIPRRLRYMLELACA